VGRFYITTTLPYVNDDPHIGFALEIIRADVLARIHRLAGDEVFFNTGTDEHGLKIYRKALEAGLDPQTYCDNLARKFDDLKGALNLSYDNFIRTTDDHHKMAAQTFWRKCGEKGDIYKKSYQIKYCVGCELEKTDSELVEGKCPLHPKIELEIIEEENYFFRFSKYQGKLLELYEKADFVIPAFRQKEIREFVSRGLADFSISRLKEKMPWGIEVPDDPTQVMYVWFDALVNYISALGWPEDEDNFTKWWPGRQIAGKDNLRQQTAMWQAMLMSAGLPNSKQIFIEGFITSGGQKMSKSLGNVINPIEYVEKYGVEAVRYFLLAKIDPFEDSDITPERFESTYQADLANGLGNLVARVATMAQGSGDVFPVSKMEIDQKITKFINEYRFDKAMELIWDEIGKADGLINEKEVWKLEGEEKRLALSDLVGRVRQVGVNLQPFLPVTSEKIRASFGEEKIIRGENLFQRLI
jgi:methionyl-tRNA synthetase